MQVSTPTMAPWWQLKIPTDASPACRNGTTQLASTSPPLRFVLGLLRGTRARRLGIHSQHGCDEPSAHSCGKGDPIEEAGPLSAMSRRIVPSRHQQRKDVEAGNCGGCEAKALLI